jgi:hypothetical protein
MELPTWNPSRRHPERESIVHDQFPMLAFGEHQELIVHYQFSLDASHVAFYPLLAWL